MDITQPQTSRRFNSTMVRLKCKRGRHHRRHFAFQFHYGSIKMRSATRFCRQKKRFNSTMVRLKSRSVRSWCEYLTLFQFHYGSIKIFCCNIKKNVTVRFQFHYGSIKIIAASQKELGNKLFQFHYGSIKIKILSKSCVMALCFNSTMVRLKSRWQPYCQRPNVLFQFHYGSIKIACRLAALLCRVKFQFHYGSIKIRQASRNLWEIRSFNSTMVRLKCIWPYNHCIIFVVSIPLWFD